MAPNLSEDEIDDLIYLSRAGEDAELTQMLKELAEREKATVAEVLEAAKDDGKATCLHMAAANGHSSKWHKHGQNSRQRWDNPATLHPFHSG